MKKKNFTVRINSRVRPEQKAYIKEYAIEHKMSEGEVHRLIVDTFIQFKDVTKNEQV